MFGVRSRALSCASSRTSKAPNRARNAAMSSVVIVMISLSGAAAPPDALPRTRHRDAMAASAGDQPEPLQDMDHVHARHDERDRHHGTTRYAVAVTSIVTALRTKIVMALPLARGTKPPLIEARPERPEQRDVGLLNLIDLGSDRVRIPRMTSQVADVGSGPHEMLLGHDHLTFRTAQGAPPMPRHGAMASGAASDRSGSCRDEPTRRVVAEPRINPAVGQPPIRPLESDPRLQIALNGERQGLQKRPIVHLVRPNVLCEMIHGPQHAVFTRPVDETRILVRERVEPVVPAIERWPDHERMPVDRPELDATIQPPKRRPHPVHAGLARLAGRLTLRLDPLTRGTISTDPASRVLHLLNRWFHPTLLGNVMWPHGHSLTWT